MLSFLGRKKNNIISLQAIRRWESRTFLGKWWQQQEAVLFILTRRQISTCNQEDLTHTRTVYLSQQTLGLQFPLQSFLLGCWCLCCTSTQQAVGKSNHHPFLCSYNPTSIVSLDSAVVTVNKEKKKSKHIHQWATEQCDAADKWNKYCDLSEPFKLSFEAKTESVHSDSSRRWVEH